MSAGRTVVGWDGSDQSARALEWAARRAARQRGSLLIATATDRFEIGYAVTPEQEEAARQELSEAVDRLRRSYPHLPIETQEIDGTPTRVLEGLSSHADLLVVGAARSGGPHRRAAWSVGGGLAVHSHCPVAVISGAAVNTAHGDVVVGVDGSELSFVAAEFAANEARAARARLRIVMAWREPESWTRPDSVTDDILRRMRAEHTDAIAVFASRVREAFPKVDILTTLSHGSMASAIAAVEPKPSLVVIGTRHHNRLSEALLGSVAHELLANQTSAIVVVPIDATRTMEPTLLMSASSASDAPALDLR